jgi:hypothetical protein
MESCTKETAMFHQINIEVNKCPVSGTRTACHDTKTARKPMVQIDLDPPPLKSKPDLARILLYEVNKQFTPLIAHFKLCIVFS